MQAAGYNLFIPDHSQSSQTRIYDLTSATLH